MKEETSIGAARVNSTRVAPGIYYGRLMSPEEVGDAIRDRAEAERRAIGAPWTLCGDVTRDLFELLRSSRLLDRAMERISAFSSPEGANYAVFTNQLGAFQHRFLVPLYDEGAIAFVKDLTKCRLAYSLGGDDTSEAVLWWSQLRPHEVLPLQALCGQLPPEHEGRVAQEYPNIVRAMVNAAQVPSTRADVAVKYVTVAAVPPHRVLLSNLGFATGQRR
jgi:hypothetical protein